MRRTSALRRGLRLLGLAACVAAVAVLGVGGPAWATSSLAQTVPTVTKSPTAGPSPTATSALPSATLTPSPEPPTPTLTPGRVRPTATPTATSAAPSATPTLGPTPAPEAACIGGVRTAGALPPAAPKSLGARSVRAWLFAWPAGAPAPCRITLALLPAHRLPAPPAGWRLASGGVRLSAVDLAGQPLAAAGRFLICSQLPAGPPPGEGWTVAALEGRAWARLETRRLGAAVCGVSASLPATYALLAAAD